ncbi:c-type cytochrome [Marivita sp. S2033]|uniref:c-type cytochrome n=1 Tax=Marivita sp. S2033 TaxID=3373187 RepID=UPI0039827589
MKTVVRTLAALAVLGALGGAAVVGIGLYNVSAQPGHFPGVSWVLHTTYRNSVRLRAPDAGDVPDLTDPAMIELGARHYDTACRTCHAAPDQARSATMVAMVPAPPHISDAVKDWEPRHMHWIVHNGIKMSGMPHWPAERSDDVWPVVAFLSAVKSGMSGVEYAELTAIPQQDGLRGYCAGCHDIRPSDHVPRLDIQNAAYLKMSMLAYRDGARQSGIMAQAVSKLPESALDEMANWFASQTPSGSGAGSLDPDLVMRGRDLAYAASGDPDVPACRACHGPEASEASPFFPSLSGQPAAYLRTQLDLWRQGTRGGGARSNLMQQAADGLSDADIAALAAFFASLPPSKRD